VEALEVLLYVLGASLLFEHLRKNQVESMLDDGVPMLVLLFTRRPLTSKSMVPPCGEALLDFNLVGIGSS
jgi:hypothetical protein